MSQQFDIEISGDLVDAIPRIKDKAGWSRAMARTMDYENQFTLRHIWETRLLGIKGPFPAIQGVLGAKTKRLRESATASKAVLLGDRVESSIGSNVIYARVHEFGIDEWTATRTFDRSIRAFRKVGKRRKKIIVGKTTVHAHEVHMRMPARAPFGHGIADRLPDYTAAFEKTTLEFLEGKN